MGMNVIVSACFNTHEDPQLNRKISADPSYFLKWYNSILKLGLRGILIHDCFTDDMLAPYKNDNFTFVKVDYDSELSPNDYRWFVYPDILVDFDIDNVFFTDCVDVIVASDPFKYMKNNMLYVGDECPLEGKHTGIIQSNEWCKRVYSNTYKNFAYWDKKIVNCGIVGGDLMTMFDFLDYIRIEILRAEPNKAVCKRKNIPYVVDMPTFTQVVYTHFKDRHHSGFPVNSNFKYYEENRTDVWFIHK